MPCNKRAFASPEQARRAMRTWQQRGRRSALDTVHPYLADCGESSHRGKFHIGHTHDRAPKKRGRPFKKEDHGSVRVRVFEEIDDLFHNQRARILGNFAKDEHQRRRRFEKEDQVSGGPLIVAEGGTLAPGGDELEVRREQ